MDEILAEYGLTDAREVKTPSISQDSLEPTSANDKLANVDQFRRVIGKLLYLMRGSRPDICFAVVRLSRYVAGPAKRHWTCLMHILKYLKGTRTYRVTYLRLEGI